MVFCYCSCQVLFELENPVVVFRYVSREATHPGKEYQYINIVAGVNWFILRVTLVQTAIIKTFTVLLT